MYWIFDSRSRSTEPHCFIEANLTSPPLPPDPIPISLSGDQWPRFGEVHEHSTLNTQHLTFNTMTLVIKGSGLTIEDVVKVARHNEKVELHPDAI